MANQSGQTKITSKWWFWVIIVAAVLLIGAISNATKKDEGIEKGGETTEIVEINGDNEPSETADDFPAGSKEWIEAKVNEVLSEGQLISVNFAEYNDNFALIKFSGAESWTNNTTVKLMYGHIFNILKNIQDGVLGDVDFNVVYPMVDVYGNTTEEIVIKASFKKETIKKINFEMASYKNISAMADEWWNHPNVVLED